MAAIVLLLICVLVLILVTATLLRSDRVESIVAPPETPSPFPELLSISLAFDSDHAILWETQVPALELIGGAGQAGLRLRVLSRWYSDNAARYPELYDGTSFPQWLNFLESVQLIVCGPRRVALTSWGREFLECRLSAEKLALPEHSSR